MFNFNPTPAIVAAAAAIQIKTDLKAESLQRMISLYHKYLLQVDSGDCDSAELAESMQIVPEDDCSIYAPEFGYKYNYARHCRYMQAKPACWMAAKKIHGGRYV